MIPLYSHIENEIYVLYILIDLLRPNQFIVECVCHLKERYIDVTTIEEGNCYILRIPFYAVAGSLNFPGVTVRIETPLLLLHASPSENQTIISEHVIKSQMIEEGDVDRKAYEDVGRIVMSKFEGLVMPQF